MLSDKNPWTPEGSKNWDPHELVIVGCSRVKDGPPGIREGNLIEPCAGCGEPLWVAAATRRDMEKLPNPREFRCLSCVGSAPGANPMEVLTLSPESLEELAESIVDEYERSLRERRGGGS